MSAVDLESLMTLTVGDLVEAPSITGALSPESTLFQVEAVSESGITFRVLLHGVLLTKVTLTRTTKGLAWTYN